MEQAIEKLIDCPLVERGTEPGQQDIGRVHADIWLRGQAFDKAKGRKKLFDYLPVAEAVDLHI